MTRVDGDRIYLDLDLYNQLGKPPRLVCALTERNCYLAAGGGLIVEDHDSEPYIRHPSIAELIRPGEVWCAVHFRYGRWTYLLHGRNYHFHSEYTRIP